MTSRDAKIESVRNSSNQDEVIYTAKNDIDWQVRRVAVEKINDENVLKDIVNEELTSAVAIKAMEHIDDKEFLSDICLNHPDAYVRLACINRMSDESLLLKKDLTSLLDKILFNDPNDIVLKSVCENPYLDNQESLTKAVFTIENEDIKRLLIRKITDEDMLADFALNSENKFLRLEAIQNPNLTDLDTISEIIIHDSDEFNRLMAIYKIPDEESLLEIILRKPLHHRLPQVAQNTNFLSDDYFLEILNDGTDEYACQVAAAFISDGEMLENIVLSKSSDKIRADAIRNSHFTNQKILDELIVTKTSPEILFEAISKIENQDVLKDYILNHLQHDEITAKAISRVDGTDFLRDLSTHPDLGIRFEAVKRISQFGDADGILRDIALTEDNDEICLKAVSAMKIRNDLIEVAKSRHEKNIRISALRHVADKRLIYNYFKSDIAHSGEFTPAEFALNEMALEDNDDDVKIISTGKVMDKELLDDIAAGEDVNRFEAQKRLNSLFEDIKQIEHKQILSRLIQSPDKDISSVAQATLDDLDLWEDRLSKVNEIDDINTLKDIARNDFNYFVRMEAEGKLEKMLFHIRLDEIGLKSNQEELKAIASDGEFSREIRRSALLKITDHAFVEKFENII
ncbi:MAG: hypothetical protein U0L42_03060 [Methanobrevibacter sp.]|uniref:hypothetical protein n=1 Tax=Methanobrevibacter sp. TaxID=66852 RepID=UPI002E770C4B|nr:hypothetical protein [Methanobrevibacter sp.]MEE0934630.1 hypothetical protein [Methanobrevibacter sp.]